MPKQHNPALLVKVGARIRVGRAEVAGITKVELGKRVGLARQMIAKYEAGEADPPLSTLARIAAALGTTVADLVA